MVDSNRESNQVERRHGMTEERIKAILDRSNYDQEERLKKYIDERIAELTVTVKSAYPEGDLSKHRAAHEAEIKKAEKWENLKTEFMTKVLTGGMYAAGVFVLTVIWEYVKAELRK